MSERLATKAPRLSTATWIVVLIVVLCLIGAFMVGSASSVVSISYYGSAWSFMLKELTWLTLGFVAFVAICSLDYRRWRTFALPLLAISAFLMLLVDIPGIGVSSNGSTRWVNFGVAGIQIQPSELLKLTIALYGAHIIAKRQEQGSSIRATFGPLVVVGVVASFAVLVQPDMGTAFVLVVIALTLAFVGGVPRRTMFKVLMLIGGAVMIAAVILPYRRDRLLSFVNPGSKSAEGGYQVVQSLIGMGSGSVGGLGLGNSREKWGLLPNAHTDFIFSVIGEELGLIGAMLIVLLFGLLAFKGWQAASDAPDSFGLLLGSALVVWISMEAVINMCAVLGLLPVTGIPLPFISYGGTSMVITLAAAGILVNIARQDRQDTRVKAKRPSTSASKSRASAGRQASATRRAGTSSRPR